MKKTILLVLILLAAFTSALVNAQYRGESPNIQVTLTRQEPDPVEPGSQVEVTFKLDNNGTTAPGVIVELLAEYPFSLLPGVSASKNIGTLASAQGSERSVIVKYKLNVDSLAADGEHEIALRYRTDDYNSWVRIENLMVSVRNQDPVISVERFSTNPEVTAPGERLVLKVDLRNYASSLLKNIKATLNLAGTEASPMPFSPIGSTNEKVYSTLQPSAVLPLEFNLLVDPDAQSKVYKVPLNIQYLDNLNKNYSKTITLSLVVGDEPDTSVYIDTTTVYSPGENGDVTVKIVNKGVTDIKFLNVNLNKAEGYRVLSPTNVYIGNIDSDDYETVDFKIAIDGKSKDKVTLPLVMEFKDANNQNYKKTVNLELPLYSSSEAKKLGLAKGKSTSAIIGIFVVVAVILFFAYRMWKRRKK